MRPDVVTFDCAQTLVKVDWQPAAIAVESAMRAGLTLDRQVAGELYARRLQTMWPEFMHLNLRRDADVLAEFWLRLTQEWMQQAGLPVEKASEVVGHANEILFGDGSKVFVLYEDTVPCLERLKRAGYRLAVVSNWDNSLHRTLEMHDLTRYFDAVVASLEEGVEKPDPRIFQIALERLGVPPESALHVGDNPVDDWQGAKSAGIKALVIDRDNETQSDILINSLHQLAEMLGA